MSRFSKWLLPLMIAPVVAGCSLGQGLSTSSVGGAASNAAATSKPVTATDRALQVAATSARAKKCGFFFDDGKLRANFLAAEAITAAPDALPKIQQSYDYTIKNVSATIAEEAGYCSEARNTLIKRDLTRHLAGDYTPVVKAETPGWFSPSLPTPRSREVINPGMLDDPEAPKTVRVEQ